MVRVLAVVTLTGLMLTPPLGASAPEQQAQQEPVRRPDVIFVPTRDAVVEGMLDLAGVTADDVVYDLGSGDGKIVIAAALRGARGVGIDIDPERIAEANANAAAAGVTDRVRFILGDIFDSAIPISDATVVTLYLLPQLNLKLMPRLKSELRPGTRVVSNSFDMGPDWPAERTAQVETFNIYFWTIPRRIGEPRLPITDYRFPDAVIRPRSLSSSSACATLMARCAAG